MREVNHIEGFPAYLGAMLSGDERSPYEFWLNREITPQEVSWAKWLAQLANQDLNMEYHVSPPRLILKVVSGRGRRPHR